MISSLEAIKTINACRGDALVVSAALALREWGTVSGRRELDLDLSDCMDKAPSIGLGLALAQPHQKVLVLDCDSMLRVNLGSLLTVGSVAPKNLMHLLFEDGSHSSTNGLPIPSLDKTNFVALAWGGGYPRAYEFEHLEDFVIGLPQVLKEDGPTFVSLKVIYDRDIPDYPARTLAESFKAVREALAPNSH